MSPKTTMSSGEMGTPSEAPTIILGEAETGAEPKDHAEELVPAITVSVGDLLGQRYRLIELIGSGGMSRVYKAVDAQRARSASAELHIAVKVLTRPFDDDPDAFALVQTDFQKLRSLTHPNIIRLFACDRDDSIVFITMEYLTGSSLYSKIRASAGSPGSPPALDRDDALAVITAIAEALNHAHDNQVVHGDLKPGNVLITEQGEIKVIDFGIGGLATRPKTPFERREAAQRQTAAAVTPRYASPQLMSRQKPETTDDIYALACMAYELLTGNHPFDDGGGTPTRFPPPRRPGLSPTQYAAVTRGLEFDRRSRTPTVRQFLEEFAAPDVRKTWKTPTLLIGVAIILAAVGWFYVRPMLHAPPRSAAAPAPAVPTAATQAVPVPTASMPASATLPTPGTVIRDCPSCPPMTVLPAGRFEQGSDGTAGIGTAGIGTAGTSASAFEVPRHAVAIATPIAMSTHDVTVGDFREFVTATRRDMQGCDTYDGEWRHHAKAGWNDPGFIQTDDHPVTCTSWNDATAYARWLSEKSGHRYRLPSASEWEYAARAGSDAPRPWGPAESDACKQANVADQAAGRRYPGWDVFTCDDGYVNTAPVASFKPNAFGLTDMLGNVFQWTQDCWHDDYTGAPTDGSARMDGDCTDHELRGGSWFSSPPYVRPAYRNHFATTYRTSSVGFRLVRESTP